MKEATKLEAGDEVSVSTSLVPGWGWMSSDYCDFCNCSVFANRPGLVYAAETAKAGDASASSSTPSTPSSPDYSTTNNQVENKIALFRHAHHLQGESLGSLSSRYNGVNQAYPPQELDVLSKIDLRQSGVVYPQVKAGARGEERGLAKAEGVRGIGGGTGCRVARTAGERNKQRNRSKRQTIGDARDNGAP
eukprot:768820-Hanusia_phi.AAC.8